MLVRETRAYPRGASFRCSTRGLAPDLPTNIGQGWKGLTGTNTQSYCEHSQITIVLRFIPLGPGMCQTKA